MTPETTFEQFFATYYSASNRRVAELIQKFFVDRGFLVHDSVVIGSAGFHCIRLQKDNISVEICRDSMVDFCIEGVVHIDSNVNAFANDFIANRENLRQRFRNNHKILEILELD
jgi:hypothetical protein